MDNFDLGRELEHLNIEKLIDDGAEYIEIVEAIAQIPLEGEREQFIEDVVNKRGGTKAAVRNDIRNYLKNSSAKGRVKQERKELDENEQREAMALLQSPQLLEDFLDTANHLGCVGEEENKVFLYSLGTSRNLENPIGAIVKGESSAGKNYTVATVLQFFPEEEVMQVTTLTPKALYHKKDGLKNKILAVNERVGGEGGDYPLRALLSEKKLIISTPVKNPKTERFETEEIEVEGPVAYVETTTQIHAHDENETRLFSIFIDESQEQTHRIHESQNRLYKTNRLNKQEVLRPWKNAQRLLTSNHILIPFVDLISFPRKPLRVRRDRLRFLSLIEAFALLFQHQRRTVEVNGQKYIVADIEDYTIACALIQKILESVLKGLSPKVKDLIEAAQKTGGKDFTNKDLAEHIRWGRQTLTKYIKEAVSLGYFEITERGGQGKVYRYQLIKPEETLFSLRTPEEMAYEMHRMHSNVQEGFVHSKALPDMEKKPNVQNVQIERDATHDA